MIIKQLLETGTCFAVIQSNSYLTKARMYLNQEWEIIASTEDYKELRKLKFAKYDDHATPVNQKNPEGIISYTLDREEIVEFKNLIADHFDKVQETTDGMVWEIKENSFKQYLKAS